MSAAAGEPGDDRIRPLGSMTIRTYRITADGQREDFTATLVVPPATEIPINALEYGPCSCPLCNPARTRRQEPS